METAFHICLRVEEFSKFPFMELKSTLIEYMDTLRDLLGARLLIMGIIVYRIGNHWPEGHLALEQWNSM